MIYVYGPTFLSFEGELWRQITYSNSTNRDNTYKATISNNAAYVKLELEVQVQALT